MPTLNLVANRIQLRLAVSSDMEAIHDLLAKPETDRFNALGIPENLEATQTIMSAQIEENQQENLANYTFVIEALDSNTFIGLVGFKLGSLKYKTAEIWYKLNQEYWNKGFATEAVVRILEFGFNNLKLHRISAGCATANMGSYKVLEKAGMLREGLSRQLIPLKTGWSDCYEYAILADDFQPKKSI